jgi:nitrite reductase/ring-hydroxylating ferredoxin subunit
LLGVIALVAASGIFGASAQVGSTELVHFVTPDREIECDMAFDPYAIGGGAMGHGSVVCAIHRKRFRHSVGANVDLEKPSRRWVIIDDDSASGGRRGRGFSSAAVRVLRNGQAVRVGPFRCTYRTARVTCVSTRSGHGFSISNKTQRTF